MSLRLKLAVVLIASCVLTFPTYSTETSNVAKARTIQGSGLTISTTTTVSPSGSIVKNLIGRYTNGDRLLNLRAVVAKQQPLNWAASPNAPSDEGAMGEDPVYSNDSEMTRSDGTVVVEAIYDYDRPAGRDMVYLTLNGVSFAFDLNTGQQTAPVSDSDIEQLNIWLNSDEGLFVRQAGVALVQRDQQEPYNDALLMYCITAMAIGDSATTQAVIRRADQRLEARRSHHRSFNVAPASTQSTGSSLLILSDASRFTVEPPNVVQCPSGCGPGCYVIPNRWGAPIYCNACQWHDDCVGSGSRLTRRCWTQLALAAACVIKKW